MCDLACLCVCVYVYVCLRMLWGLSFGLFEPWLFGVSPSAAVGPVVLGRVRAEQQLVGGDRKRHVGIIIHGDAALAGQGACLCASVRVCVLRCDDPNSRFFPQPSLSPLQACARRPSA